MFYKLSKWLFEKLEKKFTPKIPIELIQAFGGAVDLEYMRYKGKVLSVDQVDKWLTCARLVRYASDTEPSRRMYIKNRLIQFKLMEMGDLTKLGAFESDDPTAGFYIKPTNIWRDGEPLFDDSALPEVNCHYAQGLEDAADEINEQTESLVDDGDGRMDKLGSSPVQVAQAAVDAAARSQVSMTGGHQTKHDAAMIPMSDGCGPDLAGMSLDDERVYWQGKSIDQFMKYARKELVVEYQMKNEVYSVDGELHSRMKADETI